MKPIRVLIVEDSAFYRQAIAGMLKSSPYVEIVGAVADGSEAIKVLPLLHPDVITLDLDMPVMDGFTFLRWLMANKPLPVLVISSYSENSNVFRALEMGALDFLPKTTEKASNDFVKLQDELVGKVETIAMVPADKLRDLRMSVTRNSQATAAPEKHLKSHDWNEKTKFEVVVIGASTGGPPAIQAILSRLSKDFPVPIAIAQHMPPGFTQYFSDRLNHVLPIAVKEARTGDMLEAGKVLICPGGHHLRFRRAECKTFVDLQSRQGSDKYVPSVDALMISAAEIFHSKALGILLTGMGNDGTLGMKRIKENGGGTLAESEKSAVIFGMPREAIQAGVVDKVLPLSEIADEIIDQCLGL